MTTARERAKAFVQSYGCGLGSDQTCSGEDCPCVEKAAQALRQAENDKLEEAAALFPVKKTRVSYYRAATIQERIRSLKTTKD